MVGCLSIKYHQKMNLCFPLVAKTSLLKVTKDQESKEKKAQIEHIKCIDICDYDGSRKWNLFSVYFWLYFVLYNCGFVENFQYS